MLHKWSLHWKWLLYFTRMTDKNKTAKGKLTFQRNVKYMRLLRPYEMFLVIIIGNILFFLCVYVHGWPKNRFSVWVAINVIEVSFDRSTSVLKDFPFSRPARLHCTPLHARFFFFQWLCCLLSTVCHFRVYIAWQPCDSKNKKAPISTYKIQPDLHA